MIPISKIVPENLYSQEDAPVLLGVGFSKRGAKEAINEACRNGELNAQKWRRRYWFSGADFLVWVRQWFGSSELRKLAFEDQKTHNKEQPDGSGA